MVFINDDVNRVRLSPVVDYAECLTFFTAPYDPEVDDTRNKRHPRNVTTRTVYSHVTSRCLSGSDAGQLTFDFTNRQHNLSCTI